MLHKKCCGLAGARGGRMWWWWLGRRAASLSSRLTPPPTVQSTHIQAFTNQTATIWRIVAPYFDKHRVHFAALSKLRNPYTNDGSGYIYIVCRVRRDVHNNRRISRVDYRAALQIKVGYSRDFETRQRAYSKCRVDWVLKWEMKLWTPHRMLLVAKRHSSTKASDGEVPPYPASDAPARSGIRNLLIFDASLGATANGEIALLRAGAGNSDNSEAAFPASALRDCSRSPDSYPS
ncbi:hypothetical protein B0H13DRAFT_1852568 [Mycena leptocephala]|nr:hypothetical protein B0H13DRAFT_1852568 [Mycena leptocephala]